MVSWDKISYPKISSFVSFFFNFLDSSKLHSVGQSLCLSRLLQMALFHSSYWPNNVPLYLSTTSSLSIPLSMDIWVASMSWLLSTMLQWWTMGSMYPFETCFSLGICPRVGLWNLMVALFLVLKGTSILFSIVAIPIYIPTNNVEEFHFLQPSPEFIICRFFLWWPFWLMWGDISL